MSLHINPGRRSSLKFDHFSIVIDVEKVMDTTDDAGKPGNICLSGRGLTFSGDEGKVYGWHQVTTGENNIAA
jgi:hypothetical protein